MVPNYIRTNNARMINDYTQMMAKRIKFEIHKNKI